MLSCCKIQSRSFSRWVTKRRNHWQQWELCSAAKQFTISLAYMACVCKQQPLLHYYSIYFVWFKLAAPVSLGRWTSSSRTLCISFVIWVPFTKFQFRDCESWVLLNSMPGWRLILVSINNPINGHPPGWSNKRPLIVDRFPGNFTSLPTIINEYRAVQHIVHHEYHVFRASIQDHRQRQLQGTSALTQHLTQHRWSTTAFVHKFFQEYQPCLDQEHVFQSTQFPQSPYLHREMSRFNVKCLMSQYHNPCQPLLVSALCWPLRGCLRLQFTSWQWAWLIKNHLSPEWTTQVWNGFTFSAPESAGFAPTWRLLRDPITSVVKRTAYWQT